MLSRIVKELAGSDEPNPELQKELNIERVYRVTNAQLLVAFGYLTSIAIAGAYAFFLHDADRKIWLLTLPLLIIASISVFIAFQNRKRERPTKVRRRSVRLISSLIILYGAVWGATITKFVILIPETNLMMLLIVIGVSSAAIPLLFFLPCTAIMFGVLAVTPVVIAICLNNPDMGWMILFLYLAYFLTSGTAAFTSFNILKENLTLRLSNEKWLRTTEESVRVKSEFIASMSHEIRTPLNAIAGYTQIMKLETSTSGNAKMGRGLDNVLDATKHLLGLVNTILEISKLEAGDDVSDPELITPSEIFKQIIPMIKDDLDRKGQQWDGIKKSGKFIHVDKQKLRQILLNLINNAVKYTPEGGKIEFGCYETGDSMLRIYVSDDGIGIPKEEQDKVFQRFFRARNTINVYEGTGLGLYHSKEMVQMMGGIMGFESTESGGTTFHVDFPIAQ